MANALPKRKSIRIPDFDYNQTGAYFVTICTDGKLPLFGKIIAGEMVTNDIGLIAHTCWTEIPNHFPDATLIEHIIMPNHVHGIIVIQNDNDLSPGAACCAPTSRKIAKPVKGSLPVIVRSFKSAVTKAIKSANPVGLFKIWQRGYYERVIRNDKELTTAINYIKSNPTNWEAKRT